MLNSEIDHLTQRQELPSEAEVSLFSRKRQQKRVKNPTSVHEPCRHMTVKKIIYLFVSVACIVSSLGTLPIITLAEFIIYDLLQAK